MFAILPIPNARSLSAEAETAGRRRQPVPRLVPDFTARLDRRGREEGFLQLPLSHREGSVVLLDDDEDFVATLSLYLKSGTPFTSFTDPQAATEYLRRQTSAIEQERAAQLRIVDNFRLGHEPLIPQILTHWAMRPKTGPATVIVIDNKLGLVSANEVLRQLGPWPGKRLMIAGGLSNSLAIEAFNERLIDSYLSKSDPDFFHQMPATVADLLQRATPGVDDVWVATLAAEQVTALRQPEVAGELSVYCREHFTEWVVLGEPFGILGRLKEGGIEFLQLVLRDELVDMADVAEAEDQPASVCAEIRSGKALVDFELQRTMGNVFRAQPAQAFCVGSRGDVFAAARRVL